MSLQNPNQFGLTPVLGQPDLKVQPNAYFATINPDSVFTDFQVGTVVKLSPGASPAILVDSAANGETPEGVIVYNAKKNTYVAGDTVQVYAVGSVLYLQASEAIPRGSQVGFDNNGGTPYITVKGGGEAVIGIALDQAAAADDLIRVRIQPAAA